MTKLSVVIITLNEERDIARCIDSVKSVADEIIVVDSFSTDKTKEICLSKNVRFIENKWEGYANQKNFGHQQAANDFILSLDADESLSPELTQSIQKIKSSDEINLYQFKRLTNYCGKFIRHCSWYPDIKLRMYDRRHCKWEGNIHETLQYDSSKKIFLLEGDCLHYGFYTISEHVKQVEKFTSLMAKSELEKGTKSKLTKIIFSPVFKFIRNYFFKLGFLDGYYGFIICRISAHATFLKYIKLRELEKGKR